MTVTEHLYDIPSNEELAQLVGAAAPHFAPIIRERIAKLVAALPPDHPRQPFLRGQLRRMDELARRGEGAGERDLDLPPRPSLATGRPPARRGGFSAPAEG
ncbi:MAG: hypothetical protein QOK40_2725 [Miltoncostaeaceae bacterium]|jgi:hypothetical protein|nr:hypothetical protein [Miltoncostaeaceae bacterium]